MFSPPPCARPRGPKSIRRLRGPRPASSRRAVPPSVPGCPHLIAPEPHCPHPRRVAAHGELPRHRPGPVEGYEKESVTDGGGTPRRQEACAPPSGAGCRGGFDGIFVRRGGGRPGRNKFLAGGSRRRRHQRDFRENGPRRCRRFASQRRDRANVRSKIPPPRCPLNRGGGGAAARPAGAT